MRIIVFFLFATASALRGTRQSRRALYTVCHKLNTGMYRTVETNFIGVIRHLLLERGDTWANCDDKCKDICIGYSSYKMVDGTCTCTNDVAQTQQITCGANAQLVNGSCRCLDGFKGDAIKGCVQSCQSPYGNPCGPGSACADTESGITCTPLYDTSLCPVGCPPTENCDQGKCVCKENHVRPDPYTACIPL
jgi:hypothetical protein